MSTERSSDSVFDHAKQTLLTGIAITVPLVVTLYVLTLVLDFITNALDPFIQLLEWFGVIQQFESVTLITFLIDIGVYSFVVDFLKELIAVSILFGIMLLVGSVGHNQYGKRIVDVFDFVIASIPGLGTVYKSFRRMGDVMLGNEGENFQEVKLVQCFGEEVYVIGFKTADSPRSIERSADSEEMVAIFLPLAPNPVTGGFLTYIPEENLYDIDMTVDEAVRSILTSGVATGPDADEMQSFSLDEIQVAMDLDPRASTDASDDQS